MDKIEQHFCAGPISVYIFPYQYNDGNRELGLAVGGMIASACMDRIDMYSAISVDFERVSVPQLFFWELFYPRDKACNCVEASCY
jgi:hypothetical protein